MDIAQLRYFKNLAECESYTKAAKASYVSQPALSSAIRSLERELGFLLIDKSRPGFALTTSGRALYETASRCLNDFDRVVADCRAREALSNVIRAGVENSEFGRSVSDSIRDLSLREFPEVPIQIESGKTDALIDALREGALDIVFSMESIEDKALVCSKTISCCLAACVSPTSDIARMESLFVHDLATRNLFTYRRESLAGQRIAAWTDRSELQVIFDFEDDATLTSMVRANKRLVALVTIPSCAPRELNGLRFVPINESFGSFFVYAIQRKDVPLGNAASLLKSRLVLQNLNLQR